MRFKRFFAILISLIMVVSLVPASVFADEYDSYSGERYGRSRGKLNVTYYDSENNNSVIGTQTIENIGIWESITEDDLNFDKKTYEISDSETFRGNGNSITLKYDLIYNFGGSYYIYYFENSNGKSIAQSRDFVTANVSVYLKSKPKEVVDQWAAFFVLKPTVTDTSVRDSASFYAVGWGKINEHTEKTVVGENETAPEIQSMITSEPSIANSSVKIDGSVALPSEYKDTAKWKPIWYRVIQSRGQASPDDYSHQTSWHVDGYLKNIEEHRVNVTFFVNGVVEKNLTANKGSTIQKQDIPTPSVPAGKTFLGWSTDGTEENIITNENIAKTKYYEDTVYHAVFGEEDQVVVSYTANPSNGGWVSRKNDTVYKETGNITEDVTATANEGFEFIGWAVRRGTERNVPLTDGVLSADTINSYAKSHNRYEAVTFVAKFTPKAQYTVKGSIDNGGKVTNADQTIYAGEDSKRMDFKAADGYYITSITVNGVSQTVSEYQTEYKFQRWNVNQNWEVVVKTSPIEDITINFVSDNDAMGSVSLASQTVKATDSKASQSVTANPEPGYKFVEWKLGDESISSDATFTPDKPETGWIDGMTYTAVFAEVNKVTIHFVSEDENKGTVDGDANQSLNPVRGNAEAVTAVPKDGYEFEGWYLGNEKVGSTTEFTPERPSTGWTEVTYTAKFKEKKVTINYVGTTGGEVTPASEKVDAVTGVPNGSTAQPSKGYAFDKWTTDREGNNTVSSENPFVPTKAEGTVWTDGTTYYAQFKKVASVINYRSENVDFGTVKLNETGASELGATQETVYVADNTNVKGATATAKAGYEFVGWYVEGSDTAYNIDNSITPNKPAAGTTVTYVAKFREKAHVTITVDVNDSNMGSVNPSNPQELNPDNGTFTSVAATAKAGYEFVNWTNDATGETVTTNGTLSLTKPENGWTDASYTANFRELEKVNIIFKTNDVNMGTVNDTDKVTQSLNPETGVAEAVQAKVKWGYRFTGWYLENGTEVGNSTNFAPTKESGTNWIDGTTYVAVFVPVDDVTIHFESEDTGKGTVNGVNKVSQNLNPAIGIAEAVTAEAKPGYEFEGWYIKDGAKIDGANAEFTPVKGEKEVWTNGTTYVAKFKEKANVTISYVAAEGGKVDRNSDSVAPATGNIAEKVTAEPISNEYRFVNWTVDGTEVSKNAELDVVTINLNAKDSDGIYKATTFTANFEKKDKFDVTGTIDNGNVTNGNQTGIIEGEPSDEMVFTAENGYYITEVKVNGTAVTDLAEGAESYTFDAIENITENVEVKATTAEKKSTINYTAENGGSVDNHSETFDGLTGTINGSTAEPLTGYEFDGWYDGDKKVSDSAEFVPERPEAGTTKNYVAKFKELEAKITYAAGEGGFVDKAEETVRLATESSVPEGSTAEAYPGYRFIGWFDKDNTLVTENDKITPAKPTSDVTYTAKFEKVQVTINYVAVGNGSVSPESETVEALTGLKVVGGNVTDEIISGSVPTADKGYRFVGWTTTENGTDYIEGTDADGRLVPRPVDDLYTAATYYAHFEVLEDVTLSFEVNDEAMGSVLPADDQKLNPETGIYNTVAAEAKDGYEFVNWTDKATGEVVTTDKELNLTKPTTGWKDAAYVANFKELNKAVLTFAPNDERFGSVSTGMQELNPKTGVFEEVTAKAEKGYKFVEWVKEVPTAMAAENNGGREVVSTDTVLKLTKPETGWENGHYIAVFEELPAINVKYVATEGGKVSLDGETISIAENNAKGSTAKADEGYRFVNWTAENGAVVGLNYEYVPKNLEADATFTANFVRKDHKLLVDHIYRINGENAEDLTYSKDTKDVKYGDAFEENMDLKASYRLNRIDVYFGTEKASDEALAAANVNIDLENGVITGNIPDAQVTVRFIYDFVKNKEDDGDNGGNNGGGNNGGGSDKDYSGEEVEIIEDPEVALSDSLNDIDHYAYIFGYEDDTVRPNNDITREEVATIFYRLLTDPARDAYFTDKNNFPDVESGRWSNKAISTLSNAGIISGYPEDGTFRPANPITRAEFASIVSRFDSLNYNGADRFNDISGHWAGGFINAASEKGWINGYPDGSFKPQNNITRAEAITLINNVLNRHVDSEGLHEDAKKWSDNKESDWFYHAVMEATNSHDYEKSTSSDPENWTAITENRTWEER